MVWPWPLCVGWPLLGLRRHSGTTCGIGRGSLGRSPKKVLSDASTSAAHPLRSMRALLAGRVFQIKVTMSPMSSISTGDRRAVKYTSVLFALLYGVRCMCARTGDTHFFSATYSARLSTSEGASRTNRGSWMAGYTRVNAFRSRAYRARPVSWTSYVRQSALAADQPRNPFCRRSLLT